MLLPLLLAAGVIEVSAEPTTGAIVAAADCIVTAISQQPDQSVGVALPHGAPTWPRPFDPGDHGAYAYNFGPVLTDGERIASVIRLRMSSTAAALGVVIDQDAGFRPIIDDVDGRMVQVWFRVDDDRQDAPEFDASGVRIAVNFRVRTDATPPRTFDRSGVLIVRQQ